MIERKLWFSTQEQLNDVVEAVRWAADQAVGFRDLLTLADALEHGNAPAGEPRPEDARVEGESNDLLLHVKDADMCVWVVLPGRRAARLALGGTERDNPDFSHRDRLVITALLQAAQDENTQAARRKAPITVSAAGM